MILTSRPYGVIILSCFYHYIDLHNELRFNLDLEIDHDPRVYNFKIYMINLFLINGGKFETLKIKRLFGPGKLIFQENKHPCHD